MRNTILIFREVKSLKLKNWGAFIVPSPWFLPIMVRIKRSDEKSIVLVTAKRKKLLSVLNAKSP